MVESYTTFWANIVTAPISPPAPDTTQLPVVTTQAHVVTTQTPVVTTTVHAVETTSNIITDTTIKTSLTTMAVCARI